MIYFANALERFFSFRSYFAFAQCPWIQSLRVERESLVMWKLLKRELLGQIKGQ